MNPNDRYKNRLYWEAMERASYYRWSATKNHPLPGNDPLTGKPRNGKLYSPERKWAEAEGKAARKALAKHWLGVAAGLHPKESWGKPPE